MRFRGSSRVLPQRVVELALPLAREERDDLLAARDERVAVAPDRVDRVCGGDPLGSRVFHASSAA
jgi:hypothetical protein